MSDWDVLLLALIALALALAFVGLVAWTLYRLGPMPQWT